MEFSCLIDITGHQTGDAVKSFHVVFRPERRSACTDHPVEPVAVGRVQQEFMLHDVRDTEIMHKHYKGDILDKREMDWC